MCSDSSAKADYLAVGYEAGFQDIDPASRHGGMTEGEKREYLLGWVIGQAHLARAVRKGWQIGDPGIAAPMNSPSTF